MPITGQIGRENFLEVFKLLASFYIKIFQRSKNKLSISKILKLMKSFMNKDSSCALWFLKQFSFKAVLFESIVQCNQRENRKFMDGLLYCAMLCVYDEQKEALNDFFTKDEKNPNILAKFMLNLVAHMFEAKKDYPAYFNSYMLLFVRFINLGVEAKEFMFRCRMLGRILQAQYGKTPFTALEDSNEDVLVDTGDEVPEIGVPTHAIMGMYERRKFQSTHDCEA